jgi:hypothetical protein
MYVESFVKKYFVCLSYKKKDKFRDKLKEFFHLYNHKIVQILTPMIYLD